MTFVIFTDLDIHNSNQLLNISKFLLLFTQLSHFIHSSSYIYLHALCLYKMFPLRSPPLLSPPSFLFPKTQFFYVALDCLGAQFVDQAGLVLTEIHQS